MEVINISNLILTFLRGTGHTECLCGAVSSLVAGSWSSKYVYICIMSDWNQKRDLDALGATVPRECDRLSIERPRTETNIRFKVLSDIFRTIILNQRRTDDGATWFHVA